MCEEVQGFYIYMKVWRYEKEIFVKILQPDRVTDFAFGKHWVKRDVIEVQLFHVGTTLKKESTDNKFNLYED